MKATTKKTIKKVTLKRGRIKSGLASTYDSSCEVTSNRQSTACDYC